MTAIVGTIKQSVKPIIYMKRLEQAMRQSFFAYLLLR